MEKAISISQNALENIGSPKILHGPLKPVKVQYLIIQIHINFHLI